jgi:integrase
MGVKVRERPEGSGIYWVFIDHQGKRKAKKIGTDEGTALEVAKKIEAKLVLGELDIEKPKVSSPLFKEYGQMWLALPHDWKDSTRYSYEKYCELYTFPEFGKHQLDEIRRKGLKDFFDRLLAKGLAPSTVGVIKASLSGVLGHALDSELIQSNPVLGLKIHGKKKTALEVHPLTEEEANRLFAKANQYRGGEYHPPLLCALRTGMRIGEIQALKWGDIDFNGRFIEVRRSWRNGRLTETKNKKRRRVDMSPLLAKTLKALKVIQKKRALKQGRSVAEWVFANAKGNMMCREGFRRGLNKCLEKTGMRRIRVHDLRHSYATIRLMRGHNVGDVSYQLGHSSISMTYDIYGHWVPGTFKSEVDELDTPQPSATYTQPEKCASQNLQ